MNRLEGWLQAIVPMLVILVTFSFWMGKQDEKISTLIANDAAKQVITAKVVDSVGDNSYAILSVCKDVEALDETNTNCTSLPISRRM